MTSSLGAPTTPAAGAATDSRLPRRLGLWSALAVVMGSMIGSGIFRVPGAVAAETGTIGAMMLAWVVAGLVTLCGALAQRSFRGWGASTYTSTRHTAG